MCEYSVHYLYDIKLNATHKLLYLLRQYPQRNDINSIPILFIYICMYAYVCVCFFFLLLFIQRSH